MPRTKKEYSEKTGVGKLLTFRWLKKLYKKIRPSAEAAVRITEAIKDFLSSPLTDLITDIIIPGQVDNAIVDFIRPKLPQIIGAELLIKNLPDNPTEEDVRELTSQIVEAFGTLPESKKGKFYSNVVGEITLFISEQRGTVITFGEAVGLGEEIYQEWKKLKENEEEN